MLLLDRFPPSSGWSAEILATDLSTKALAKARAAEWPIQRADEIPLPYRKTFMLKGTGANEGRMKAGQAIRSMIGFRRLNLNDEINSVGGSWDLIFCRNVLIYFDAASRRRVLDGLLGRLAPDGFLFLGHAESLTGVTTRMRAVATNVYTWTPEASSGGGCGLPSPALGRTA
jgi:chemotaxis protein methyltransferase CheR